MFRVFFASIYICKWKWRYNFNKAYLVTPYNLERTYRKIRKEQKDHGFSSDDEEIYEAAKRIYKEHEKEILERCSMSDLTEKERLDMTMDHVHDRGV